MSDKPVNPPAFPTSAYEGIGGEAIFQVGMTLRDYFAAQALMGLIANNAGEASLQMSYEGNTWGQQIAKNAYDHADAMLKARQS